MPSKGASETGKKLLLLLHRRDWKQDIDYILKVVKIRPDLKVRDTDGNTALHLSARWSDSLPIIDALLSGGADPNARNKDNETPLHKAVQDQEKHSIISALLQAGADPNLVDKSGSPPLHYVRPGHSKTIQLLLEAGTDVLARNHAGRDWLFATADTYLYTDEELCLRPCLDAGCHISTVDYHGRTLLHESFIRETLVKERIRFLIDAGANPLRADYQGNTILHEVVSSNLYGLASHDKERLLRMRYANELGLDVDCPNNKRQTPLHIQSGLGYPGGSGIPDALCLRWMLSVSENVNARDCEGATPLHLASLVSQTSVFELVKAGADALITTYEGLTPLHLAARARQSNIVAMLIQHFQQQPRLDRLVWLDVQDNRGWTPLHYACSSGRPESVRLLLDAGANLGVSGQHYQPRPWPREDDRNALEVCEDFEEERALWSGYRQVNDPDADVRGRDTSQFSAVGIKIADENRPFVDASRKRIGKTGFTEHDSARLEEIIDMMADYSIKTFGWGARAGGDIARIQINAHRKGYQYTLTCAFNARERSDELMTTRQEWLQAEERTPLKYQDYALSAAIEAKKDGDQDIDLFLKALNDRHYHLAQKYAELFPNGFHVATRKGGNSKSTLHFLAAHGFDRLLRSAGKVTAEHEFKHDRWHSAKDPSKAGLGHCNIPLDPAMQPLLYIACKRHLPNMEVIKVLVEDLDVDVNVKTQWIEGDDHNDQSETRGGGDTALHHLALGTHWWHVAQAMRYLVVDAGADIERRDELGETPLLCAARSTQVFRREAIRLLLDLGADVNAVDGSGQSFLLLAADDEELLDIVVAHEAASRGVAVAVRRGAASGEVTDVEEDRSGGWDSVEDVHLDLFDES